MEVTSWPRIDDQESERIDAGWGLLKPERRGERLELVTVRRSVNRGNRVPPKYDVAARNNMETETKS